MSNITITDTAPAVPAAERSASALPAITPLMIVVEFLVIIVVGILATSQFRDLDPSTRLSGDEAEYMTSTGTYVVQAMHEYGYIPLWQPWSNVGGEPLVQSPLSYVFNPFSMIPSLIYGNNVGIKLSIILTTILAGLGGWALGRLLGFGSLGRLVLGVLSIGRGSMYAQLTPGYYQLALNQAYFPWIAAGVVATMHIRRRWGIILLALSITLLFFSGMVWHMLPALLMVVVLVVAYAFTLHRAPLRVTIRQRALRRIVYAGLLTVVLSAVLLLPLLSDRERIGTIGIEDHPTDIELVLQRFFSSSTGSPDDIVVPATPDYVYFNFVLPAWFAGLILLLTVLIVIARPPRLWDWRIWSAAVFLFVFCTLWGTDRNPLLAGLQQVIPMLRLWRHVERVLGMASFWLAVLAAMHVDAIWRTVVVKSDWARLRLLSGVWPRRAAALLLLVASGVATVQVIQPWTAFAHPGPEPVEDAICLSWLRKAHPDQQLSAWTDGFSSIYPYLRNHVRHYHIATDFYLPGANKPTLMTQVDLTAVPPEYALVFSDSDTSSTDPLGYKSVPGSPGPFNPDFPCLVQRPGSLSYAFTIPQSMLDQVTQTDPAQFTTPVTAFARYPDRVALLVNGSPQDSLVVAIQELAYNGWTVEVDGHPAQIESVGGYNGVVLPPGDEVHRVYFQFRPPLLYLGGWITVVGCVLCILCLLKVDRFIPGSWRHRTQDLSTRLIAFLRLKAKQTWRLWTTPVSPSPDDEPKD